MNIIKERRPGLLQHRRRDGFVHLNAQNLNFYFQLSVSFFDTYEKEEKRRKNAEIIVLPLTGLKIGLKEP